jgi:hypothetical protein
MRARSSTLGRRDRGVDILGGGIGKLAERLGRTGIERIDVAAGLRLVPLAVVIDAALFRQVELDGGKRASNSGRCHD